MEKFVSVILPCRNEEKFIARCLDSILEQDYPQQQLEILVAEGMSTDQTRKILDEYANKFAQIRWFENPGKIVPTGLNILIRQAKGQIVIRMDAHNEYPKDYVSKCVKYFEEYKADNVGGVWITLPGANTLVARAIVVALTCGFGIGNADYRLGGIEPKWVDTVPFGCYRREVFERIGLFDEDLVRNQDDEFNSRLIKNGGKILLVPDITSRYHARDTFPKLWRMYFQYGYFKPLTVLKLGGVMTWRQMIPALFVASLVGLALLGLFYPAARLLFLGEFLLYFGAGVFVSAALAVKSKEFLFPYLLASFWVIHFGYGIGYLCGIWDFVLMNKHKKNKINDMAISR